MKFFKTRPQKGHPISLRGFASGVGLMARALERMTVQDGQVQWLNGIPKIIVDGASGDGDGLPEGGDEYQVLQRDSGGDAVWDWVRAADV